ncbi:uncharacterized protein UV8b_00585 [Ustilaginoidea virens]|uniref:Major facilitator superfamily (MFS) profile domain-containing protein n=1 Tax=Ustilaginoidea virens TaxID=1159556 RepID=A0A8E5HJ46_USTVR|nr:uncharacterized protein UV8b_00585 [Ustilaginoidea virens]QUC16344.1 hypothetical protein UV8b_00585 [Ustilaginoidea virens]
MAAPECRPDDAQHQKASRPADATVNMDPEKQPADAANLYSIFTPWQKRGIVLGASVAAFFSPLTAQIYLPASTLISEDLGVSDTQINLTITTFMVFQGLAPMFIGSLADNGGRRPAYVVCFLIYLTANVGLALAPNYDALLGLRCLQSAGSSSTVALCYAVVADVITSAERGQYMAFTVVPTVFGPAIGPLVGGLLSQHLGWRAIFWFLAIFSGVAMVIFVFFFPETSVWQAVRLRRRKELGSKDPMAEAAPDHASSATGQNKIRFRTVFGSLFLLFEKETGVLLWTSSVVYMGYYCIGTAIPSLFAERYDYDGIEVGLMYIPLAVGSVAAATIVGPLFNRNFKRHCIKRGIPYHQGQQQDLSNMPIEQARMEIGVPLLCLTGGGLISWGWAMHAESHVAVPCALSFVLGVGLIGYNNTTNILLADVHPGRAGTATAANNLARCLVGAGASAAIVPLIDAIGVGPAFTLVGSLYFVAIIPALILVKCGMKWRAESKGTDERGKLGKAKGLESGGEQVSDDEKTGQ